MLDMSADRDLLNQPGLGWPLMPVFNGNGNAIGFAMRKCEDNSFLALRGPANIQKCFPGWNRRDLVEKALNFVQKVKLLADHGVLINDFNPANFLVNRNLDPFSALRILATRKRVNVLFEGHLFIRLILVQLMADVFLDCLFVGPYRTHEVSPTPEMSVPIFIFQVRVTIKYQQGTFPLQIPHELRHAQVRRDAHQHVNVICTRFRFQNLHLLLLAQCSKDLTDACFYLPIHDLSPIFRRKHDMVLAIPPGV